MIKSSFLKRSVATKMSFFCKFNEKLFSYLIECGKIALSKILFPNSFVGLFNSFCVFLQNLAFLPIISKHHNGKTFTVQRIIYSPYSLYEHTFKSIKLTYISSYDRWMNEIEYFLRYYWLEFSFYVCIYQLLIIFSKNYFLY